MKAICIRLLAESLNKDENDLKELLTSENCTNNPVPGRIHRCELPRSVRIHSSTLCSHERQYISYADTSEAG